MELDKRVAKLEQELQVIAGRVLGLQAVVSQLLGMLHDGPIEQFRKLRKLEKRLSADAVASPLLTDAQLEAFHQTLQQASLAAVFPAERELKKSRPKPDPQKP